MAMPAQPINDYVVSGVKKFLDALNSSGGTPIERLSPRDARQVLIDAQNSATVDLSGVDRSERIIDFDGKDLKLHIVKPAGVKPAGAAAGLPVFMFFHGGGWVLGDFPTHRRLVRDLVVESGVAAVFPDYTPSPEASTRPPSSRPMPPPNGSLSTAAKSGWTVTSWLLSATASAGTWRPSSA